MEFIIDLSYKLILFTWGIAKIIFPLMIALEVLRDLNLLDKLVKLFKPMTDFFTIDYNSGLSMAVGVIFGLLYGAGAIIKNIEEENPDKRSIFLISMFLSLCHAIVEDTFIFTSIGASFFWVFMSRLLSASVFTFVLSRCIKVQEELSS